MCSGVFLFFKKKCKMKSGKIQESAIMKKAVHGIFIVVLSMKRVSFFLLLLSAGLFIHGHAGAVVITCPDTADVYIDQCLTCSPPGGGHQF
jgi:hypothetical protein